MSTTPNENTTVPEDPIFEPFPEPNTMPSGWDMAGLSPEPQPVPTTSQYDTPES